MSIGDFIVCRFINIYADTIKTNNNLVSPPSSIQEHISTLLVDSTSQKSYIINEPVAAELDESKVERREFLGVRHADGMPLFWQIA